MNKITRTACMIAVLALAFTSCKKNENETKSFAFHATVEQFVEVNENGEFERMYIDENKKIQFEAGDLFALYQIGIDPTAPAGNAHYVLNAAGDLEPAAFATVGTTTDGAWYAFYPGENAGLFDPYTRVGKFILDDEQVYRGEINGVVQMPEKALYMAAKDDAHEYLNDAHMSFKNIMGILSLRLYSPEGQKIKSITVKDNRFSLNGTVSVNLTALDPSVLTEYFRNYDESNTSYMAELTDYLQNQLQYSVEDSKNETVLKCYYTDPETDVDVCTEVGATAAEATRFYIVLRPLALMNGCQLTITFEDGTINVINSTKDNRISPNVIRNISPINVDLQY